MERQHLSGRGAMKFLLRLSIVLLFVSCSVNDPSVNAILKDYKANLDIKNKKNDEALIAYNEILEKDALLPSVHSNIGVLLHEGAKPDEGFKSLSQALKLANEQKQTQSQFVINFNLGVYYGAQKKIPEALKHYQAALEIVPTAKEVKHNIELLIQASQNSSKGDKDSEDSKNDPKEDSGDKNKSGENDQKDEKEENDKKDYKENSKYKPRPFKGEELSEGDVKKILGELKNQEQKIRANFEKKERKDKNNDKDW